ncbi:SPFH domain-containing protein [Peptoniphilus mikwangii]|uniref:SPFH domain-containing protein n=1 Tax=Peptoniphilus mikwangii TaxID=1354300 RepID=UPI0004164E2A|nr:SPFH domain-containing protein [Peptoniphilus mikwangii]
MGLLKVGLGAASSVLADQWREYFYCSEMLEDVLVRKGEKRKAKKSFNDKGSDNIITNGSIIAINEGQCMIIVDQGAIAEVSAEAGEFVFDNSTEPSIFYGDLKEEVKKTFDTFVKRFTMGGDTGKDQRVYFFNLKDIIGNKYGTVNAVPFRVVDTNIGLDIDISIRCHGEYVYKITDPILFYKNICGNVDDEFYRDRIESQLRSELLTALQPAFARISEMGIRYSALPGHAQDLSNILNDILSDKWGKHYGIEITEFGVSSVKASEEDENMIKEIQRNAAFRNPTMAAAHLVGSQAEAMKSAASNESGAFMAFAGMNMANSAGGMNAQGLFNMGQEQAQTQQVASQTTETPVGWTCSCGTSGNTGKFCMECGSQKPEELFWTCECGVKNKGKFCMECGSPKPTGALQYKCDKCGWEPSDPKNPPKFCPECGDPFDDGDVK